jgi:hypothetical protein
MNSYESVGIVLEPSPEIAVRFGFVLLLGKPGEPLSGKLASLTPVSPVKAPSVPLFSNNVRVRRMCELVSRGTRFCGHRQNNSTPAVAVVEKHEVPPYHKHEDSSEKRDPLRGLFDSKVLSPKSLGDPRSLVARVYARIEDARRSFQPDKPVSPIKYDVVALFSRGFAVSTWHCRVALVFLRIPRLPKPAPRDAFVTPAEVC